MDYIKLLSKDAKQIIVNRSYSGIFLQFKRSLEVNEKEPIYIPFLEKHILMVFKDPQRIANEDLPYVYELLFYLKPSQESLDRWINFLPINYDHHLEEKLLAYICKSNIIPDDLKSMAIHDEFSKYRNKLNNYIYVGPTYGDYNYQNEVPFLLAYTILKLRCSKLNLSLDQYLPLTYNISNIKLISTSKHALDWIDDTCKFNGIDLSTAEMVRLVKNIPRFLIENIWNSSKRTLCIKQRDNSFSHLIDQLESLVDQQEIWIFTCKLINLWHLTSRPCEIPIGFTIHDSILSFMSNEISKMKVKPNSLIPQLIYKINKKYVESKSLDRDEHYRMDICEIFIQDDSDIDMKETWGNLIVGLINSNSLTVDVIQQYLISHIQGVSDYKAD